MSIIDIIASVLNYEGNNNNHSHHGLPIKRTNNICILFLHRSIAIFRSSVTYTNQTYSSRIWM